LFVVGIATGAPTQEEGRRIAFENGKREAMNYAQMRGSELQSLVIETQMTYEEPNPDGTYTVFRLLYLPLSAFIHTTSPDYHGAQGAQHDTITDLYVRSNPVSNRSCAAFYGICGVDRARQRTKNKRFNES
jgi:hypothetical protein